MPVVTTAETLPKRCGSKSSPKSLSHDKCIFKARDATVWYSHPQSLTGTIWTYLRQWIGRRHLMQRESRWMALSGQGRGMPAWGSVSE